MARRTALFLAALGAIAVAAMAVGVILSSADDRDEATAERAIPSPTTLADVLRARLPDGLEFNDDDLNSLCSTAKYELIDFPSPDRVFRAGEMMTVTIRYDVSPECARISANFGVRHVPGSPRAEFYCPGGCPQGFNGNIPTESVVINAPTGTVTLTAQPGEFPPVDLASRPDLEGARVCAVVVGVDDADGHSAFLIDHQFDLGCGREPSPLRSEDDPDYPF